MLKMVSVPDSAPDEAFPKGFYPLEPAAIVSFVVYLNQGRNCIRIITCENILRGWPLI